MSNTERNSGKAFQWFKARGVLLNDMDLPYAPEDLLLAINIRRDQVSLIQDMLELACYKLMSNKLFPRARAADVVGLTRYGALVACPGPRILAPIAFVTSPDFTAVPSLTKVINPDQTIVFARHLRIETPSDYTNALALLLPEVSKLLQRYDIPSIPNYQKCYISL